MNSSGHKSPNGNFALSGRGCAAAVFCCLALHSFSRDCVAEELPAAVRFRQHVQPILETYCYGCHGEGASEGGRTLDAFTSDDAMLADRKLWWAVLKNVRAGIMPPAGEELPNDDERRQLFDWIKFDALGIDPANPDPGRVTLRRLNRTEYRNTVRDLMGVDYDTKEYFPADDSGYGFDNIGDVLSVSPQMLEKYLKAADTIVAEAVSSQGPLDEQAEVAQGKHRRFFSDGPPPPEDAARDEYARKILADFARRAYRRPVDEPTVDRLVFLAKKSYAEQGESFEAGVGRAMAAVLASPRFLFRTEEVAEATDAAEEYPLIDEYALASRLSYFLWSSMPDEELLRLAEGSELRANLPAQVERMLEDSKSEALVKNFAGQWLRARDVENAKIYVLPALGLQAEFMTVLDELGERDQQRAANDQPELALPAADDGSEIDDEKAREAARGKKLRAELDRFNELREMFTDELRQAMRRETEMYFEHVLREDRSVLEFIDSNYTFLNETLASHYGIEGVVGKDMRRVELPADSPRGGLLTQGTLLVVTSNPNRTSPVKRGLHILDNILGTPPAPPPATVPPLEQAAAVITDHRPTVRELLEQHGRDPLCHSCHARMDPLGLALENFNALGMWRETEHDRPIVASGTLLTGETFDGISELKTILKAEHRLDFYRCLTEKLLTYALGRGLEYYDEHTVDQIVEQLDREQGKFSVLLTGIIDSAPFQRHRKVVGTLRVP